ncbi:TVP38/TMEM64 family protein [Pectobacterium versatile]|uniref:TVP38/TMEM64 family protein n=1 Tax=Pectobacterium versatile TaxID=2488639 RepID=UPI001CF3D60C|nr:VTT domain-containing protein [Pectobacterium versatile]MCA6924639.1 VTT domain-containing protein [Pectobacterium versatile]MCH5081405.1 TVP38/TMEM64 family protein [Pectobacterium versatile]
MADILTPLVTYVQSSGGMGAGLFIVVFITATMLFFPASLLTALSGWLFGVTGGTLIALLGGVMSSILAFGLGKSSLFPLARRMTAKGRYLRKGLSLTHKNSIVLVLLLRLSSVVPFAPLNYGLGASGMALRAYLTATVPGLVPGTFIYAGTGAAVSDVNRLIQGGFSPMEFIRNTNVLTGVAGAIIGLVLLYLLQRSIRKKSGL